MLRVSWRALVRSVYDGLMHQTEIDFSAEQGFAEDDIARARPSAFLKSHLAWCIFAPSV